MRKSLYLAMALALGASAVITPVSPVMAQEYASPMIPPKPTAPKVPDTVVSAWGCVLAGSAGTAAAMLANSENLLNVVAGGIVSPANPAVLYIGLAGVVFTSFCSLGQSLTPLYLYYFDTDEAPAMDIAKSNGRRVAGGATPLGANGDDVMFPWQSAE
jgi:hypothetical protein